MSDSNQAGWEWRDQEEERWHAENIGGDDQLSMNELAKYHPEFESLLIQFDSHFLIPDKESI